MASMRSVRTGPQSSSHYIKSFLALEFFKHVLYAGAKLSLYEVKGGGEGKYVDPIRYWSKIVFSLNFSVCKIILMRPTAGGGRV